MFTDSHSHVYSKYYDNIKEVIDEAGQNNVDRIIICGCNNIENHEVCEVVSQYDNLFGAIGIHPEAINEYTEEDLDYIKKNISNKKIIAVGEIGLDYYYEKDSKNKQIELLNKQLKIAEDYNIPVIIHSREATFDTLNTLKKYKCIGIIHSFSGSYETAMEFIKMGYLIGVNGVITFKNANIKDVIRRLPLDAIVLETDSPYLTPAPYRGKKNEPKHIKDIASFVANLFAITPEKLAIITNNNLNRVFQKIKDC